MLDRAQLSKRLNVSAGTINAWLRKGLPWHAAPAKTKSGRSKSARPKTAKQFDPAEVRDWLVAQGLAEPPPQPPAAAPVSPPRVDTVAVTRDEAARQLGVATRTLAEWLKFPGFPGRAGTQGRRDGFFPIEQIHAWRLATFGAATESDDPLAADVRQSRAELAREQARAKRLANEKTEGELLPRDQVRREIIAYAVRIRSRLMALASRVVIVIPGEQKAAIKRLVEEQVRIVLKEAFESELIDQELNKWILEEARQILGNSHTPPAADPQFGTPDAGPGDGPRGDAESGAAAAD